MTQCNPINRRSERTNSESFPSKSFAKPLALKICFGVQPAAPAFETAASTPSAVDDTIAASECLKGTAMRYSAAVATKYRSGSGEQTAFGVVLIQIAD